jgi:phytoene dehydrogenase-like protein
MWKDLGVLPHEIHYPDDLTCIEDTDGRRFTVYTDIDRLEQHMLELAPADTSVIREFIRAARRFARINMLDLVLAKPWELVAMLPNLPLLRKWGQLTLEQYAERFSDPFLRRAFPMIQYDFPDVPMLIALTFIGGCHTGYLGWPAGGALNLAQRITGRYRELGGAIHTRSRVTEIIVDQGPSGDRAVGIRLEDGTEHRADIIISNADGYTTIFDMLGGKYTTERISEYYTTHVPEWQVMSTSVNLGVARDLTQEPHALVLWLPEPVQIAGETCDRLDLEIYAFAPELAPPGKTVVKAYFTSRYDFWKDLLSHDDAYTTEKERIAETVIACLDRRFPGLKEQVEVIDVTTPVTTERLVGSYHGFQAWPVPEESIMDTLSGKGLSRTLPGLTDFYMVGQWAGGLGLPKVAAMGRKVIQAICRQDGRRFCRT